MAGVTLTGCGGSSDPSSPSAGASSAASATTAVDTSAATTPASTAPATTAASSPTGPAASSTASGVDLSKAKVSVLTTELKVPREVVEVGGGRLLLSDQAGVVRLMAGGKLRSAPFLDVRKQILTPEAGGNIELGLAGFALAPDFTTSGYVYTFTTAKPGPKDPDTTQRVDTLTRWKADRATMKVDPGSATVLLTFPRTTLDHVGGEIVFDASGNLYTSFGAEEGDAKAQDPKTLDGTVIRIDPRRASGGKPYAIPAGNPYADGTKGRPEVWSYGYRNPWRLQWSPRLGLMVGSALWKTKPQQVNVAKAGDNAGYPDVAVGCWENRKLSAGCRTTAKKARVAAPVLEYDVGNILSGVVEITAGRLKGRVLVSDWQHEMLLAKPGTPPWTSQEVTEPATLSNDVYVWDLDTDSSGAIYALTTDGTQGRVLRVTAS